MFRTKRKAPKAREMRTFGTQILAKMRKIFCDAKYLPVLEETADVLRRAGGASLGEAVPSAAAAMEGGVHVLDEGAQVAAALNDGVLIGAVAAGEHGTASACGPDNGVAQAAGAVAVQLSRDVQDVSGITVSLCRVGEVGLLQMGSRK